MKRSFYMFAAVFVVVGTLAHAQTTIFAAASATSAVDEVLELYRQQGGEPVRASYASSGALARQIESGAPAGMYLSANPDWMDHLEQQGLLAEGTRQDLLSNSLVLVAPVQDRRSLELRHGMPLARWLNGGRLSMGDPAHVPAGNYARQALEHFGVWDDVQAQTARAENVRAAVLLVARAEAPLGIVFATDAAIEPQVRVVATFPSNSHDTIVYPAAIVGEHDSEAVRAFLAFLQTAEARQVFERYGFGVQ